MRNRFRSVSGGTYTPVIIIVAALAISAAVFFLFTKKKLQPKTELAQPTMAEGAKAPVTTPESAPPPPGKSGVALTSPNEPKAPPMSAPAGVPAASTPTAPPAPPKPSFGFARPADLGAQMAKALAAGDMAQAAQMAATGDPSQAAVAEAVFKKIFGEMGFKIGPDDQVKILGQVGDGTRISIPILKPGETSPSLSMQLEVERDQKTGWKVTQFRLPKELSAAVASITPPPPAPDAAPAKMTTGTAATTSGEKYPPPPPPPAAGSSAPMAKGGTPLFVVEENADALGFASTFVTALLGHDFVNARKVIDDTKVPSEKLAGLCIVFEEGKYQLKASKPLIITVASPNVSWVIAQVESETLQQSTEFGVELQRASETSPWQVVGLNLSELLGSFAQVTSKLGVPYTPIVQNPKGGESLALYFEYDKATLHPRAQKQLHIVAEMLKSNSQRKLRITGHTDAMGADDYNIRLSQARAQNVKQQLAALGVAPDQVITEGLGKAAPLSPNQKADGSDDPEGRSRNRRAEIFLDF